jgi:hypothetical protein
MIFSEISIGGVFVPGLLVAALLALVASLILRRIFVRIGLHRLVWHPALFDLAVYVLLLSAIARYLR